jgi:hypothetical protein
MCLHNADNHSNAFSVFYIPQPGNLERKRKPSMQILAAKVTDIRGGLGTPEAACATANKPYERDGNV